MSSVLKKADKLNLSLSLGAARAQAITNVDPDMSPFGFIRPQWVNVGSSNVIVDMQWKGENATELFFLFITNTCAIMF